MADKLIKTPRILVVSSDLTSFRSLRTIGYENGWEIEITPSSREALESVQAAAAPDLLLLDLAGWKHDSLLTSSRLRQVRPDLPIILVCDDNDPELDGAIAEMGAHDCVVCSSDERELEQVIARNLVSSNPAEPTIFFDVEEVEDEMLFAGTSPQMRKLRTQAELLAEANAPFLILGESGSGKELLARVIHKLSVRSEFRFVSINCAALPADVLEAELFGYERLSGSSSSTPGKIELCQKGTLLLNGITEMPMNVQAELLQFMRDGCFASSDGEKVVDVRLLATSEMGIEQAIAERKLREDLYQRLSSFTVYVPPLRQRQDEIPLLLGQFMNRLAKRYKLPPRLFTAAVFRACQSYAWPGNLAEMERLVKRYLIAGEQALDWFSGEREPESRVLGAKFVGVRENSVLRSGVQEANGDGSLRSVLQSVKGQAEREAIASALEQTHWNRKAAARLLKVSYRTLLYKIQQHHMSPPASLESCTAGGGLKRNGYH